MNEEKERRGGSDSVFVFKWKGKRNRNKNCPRRPAANMSCSCTRKGERERERKRKMRKKKREKERERERERKSDLNLSWLNWIGIRFHSSSYRTLESFPFLLFLSFFFLYPSSLRGFFRSLSSMDMVFHKRREKRERESREREKEMKEGRNCVTRRGGWRQDFLKSPLELRIRGERIHEIVKG